MRHGIVGKFGVEQLFDLFDDRHILPFQEFAAQGHDDQRGFFVVTDQKLPHLEIFESQDRQAAAEIMRIPNGLQPRFEHVFDKRFVVGLKRLIFAPYDNHHAALQQIFRERLRQKLLAQQALHLRGQESKFAILGHLVESLDPQARNIVVPFLMNTQRGQYGDPPQDQDHLPATLNNLAEPFEHSG